MDDKQEKLKKQLAEFKNSENIIIPWASSRYRNFRGFVKEQVLKLDLTNTSEYVYYLLNDYSLPNGTCRCGNKKKFGTLNTKYTRYCSNRCLQEYTEQNYNESYLIETLKLVITRQSEQMYPFSELIKQNSAHFENEYEYLHYLRNNKTLPNSICACGKKKKFYNNKDARYQEYCSKICAANYTPQINDERYLAELLTNCISSSASIYYQFRDLIKLKVDELDLLDNLEYFYYLRNDKTLPNSICECGKKKKFQYTSKPYCEYCSSCAKKKAQTSEVRKRIAESVSKFMQSLTEEDFKRRTEVHRSTIANESEEHKLFKKQQKTEYMKTMYSNASPEERQARIDNIKSAFKNMSEEKKLDIQSARRERNESNGNWITEEQVKDFKDYGRLVWRYTNANDLTVLENIENRGQLPEQYHLDHKYSIFQGFKDNIDAKIIGSIYNLEMLISGQNLSKNKKCSIELNSLLEEYNSHQ